MRTNYKNFELSTLVLDLDAEDSRYVRPYDGDVDGVPASKRKCDASKFSSVKKRITEFERLSQECNYMSKLTTTTKFISWRVSDHDIFSITLSPSSSEPDHHVNPVTKEVLRWNGVPYIVQHSCSKTIAYLRRRQQLQRRLQPDLGDETALKSALLACDDFQDLERLVTNTIQTRSGRELVSKCSETLGRACKSLAKKTPPAQMLSFLNNLIMNMDSQKLPVSASVLWCAYQSSLSCGIFSTAQKYLKLLHNSRPLRGTQISRTLESLGEAIAPQNPGDAGTMREADTAHQLLAIYSLLTGRAFEEGMQQSSLRDVLLQHTISSMAAHLTCLARLGAFRTMWYVWRTQYQYVSDDFSSHKGGVSGSSLADTAEESSNMAKVGEASSEENGKTFKTRAFTHAIREAIKSNDLLLELIRNPDFTRVAEDYNGNCQLDMEAIINSADMISTWGHDRQLEISPERINIIFSNDSIGGSMLALQHYLSEFLTPAAD
ncbi:hypothetical protein GGR52DRAFT_569168 [Hypoxylon sp. FL1284]|nr:hypothetical protein GGR52DRAFT_569168 [Hypoxylon sp. FL1284]